MRVSVGFFNEIVSHRGPQEETKEWFRKTKFIVLTGPRDSSQGTPPKSHLGKHQGGQEAEDRKQGSAWTTAFTGVSAGETEQDG